MKIISLIFLVLTGSHVVFAKSKFKVPQLEFEYAGIFDSVCARKAKVTLKPEMVQGARSSNPIFQKSWNALGPKLLKVLFQVVDQGFYRSELTVYTTVCNYIPMSQPFFVNVRPFVGKEDPQAQLSIVQVTFHEFIHKFLSAHWDWSKSEMLGKYKDESFSVKAHLHLMALEMEVYGVLKNEGLLATAESSYVQRIGGDYRRAWEIIQKEGRQVFVEEARASMTKKR